MVLFFGYDTNKPKIDQTKSQTKRQTSLLLVLPIYKETTKTSTTADVSTMQMKILLFSWAVAHKDVEKKYNSKTGRNRTALR